MWTKDHKSDDNLISQSSFHLVILVLKYKICTYLDHFVFRLIDKSLAQISEIFDFSVFLKKFLVKSGKSDKTY